MTREEIIKLARGLCTDFKCESDTMVDFCNSIIRELKQEPKTGQFAKWVATEIFDDNWEYNKDAFAELACRKLAELGIVRAKGEEWELVDSQESEDEEGEQPKIIKCPNCGNVQFADKEWCPDCGCRMVEPQERSEE